LNELKKKHKRSGKPNYVLHKKTTREADDTQVETETEVETDASMIAKTKGVEGGQTIVIRRETDLEKGTEIEGTEIEGTQVVGTEVEAPKEGVVEIKTGTRANRIGAGAGALRPLKGKKICLDEIKRVALVRQIVKAQQARKEKTLIKTTPRTQKREAASESGKEVEVGKEVVAEIERDR